MLRKLAGKGRRPCMCIDVVDHALLRVQRGSMRPGRQDG